ncbi:hypothetical protein [Haloflavibacter putidus]|uniref:Uncharacterized protein n=1 Tax=Haloflavibacter putidus TaxID=2576776 RepID=A0A507ZTQ1_9FLAO|nr:hypothetical protein [Haloflavibacter putidus]TQD36962.1 hypothetical protein FKR84_10150 [Haloflavibacter putidus]
MKFIRQNLKILLLAFSFTFVACSSDDDGGPSGPGDPNNAVSSYDITIEGVGEYSKTWNLNEEYQDGGMSAVYLNDQEEGQEVITVYLNDQTNNLNMSGGLVLSNGQPLPLGDLDNGWNETLDVSGLVFTFDSYTSGYSSLSGTVSISNLEVFDVSTAGGAASFDMQLDGTFDDITTQEVEQINITGTFRFNSGLF